MAKQFYTDYGLHMLRLYFRCSYNDVEDAVGQVAWRSVNMVLENRQYSENQIEILKCVFSDRDTLADKVYQASKKFDIEQDKIYDMVYSLVKYVCEKRGLI